MINMAEFKKFFLFNLVGSLIVCALIAVVTVLVGEFNQTTARVLFTLFMVVLHSLISLSFIWDDARQKTFERLAFFINVVFILIVLSFLTSIFGIWDIVQGETIWRLYQTYFVIGFAALHGDILSKALGKEDYINKTVYINYVFMGIVVLMLLPIIYIDNAARELGEFYYRLLAAAGIIDGTLSILTMIFYKLYMNKNPQAESPLQVGFGQNAPNAAPVRRGFSAWVWILILYLGFQILFSFTRYLW